jgi:hypothetical protein
MKKSKPRHKPPKLLLSQDQERKAREMFGMGHTRDQVAWAIGVPVSLLYRRMRDQLKDVRVGRGRSAHKQPAGDPTPEQIAARIEEVHAIRLERFNRLHGPG